MTVQTINLKGNEYATVPQRLKQFRQDSPRSSIATSHEVQPDGTIVFTAKIIKDKADEYSADATGHSYGKNTGDKAFEKLETVAVGRALALLGYLNNGQIATTEEMVEFEEYRQETYEQAVLDVHAAKTKDEFKEIMARLKPDQVKAITPVINQRVKELQNANASQS